MCCTFKKGAPPPAIEKTVPVSITTEALQQEQQQQFLEKESVLDEKEEQPEQVELEEEATIDEHASNVTTRLLKNNSLYS